MLAPGKEAIRVKAHKFEDKLPIELRKFSVDPQITSLEELRNILITAFDLKGEFTLSYKSIDDIGHEDYLTLFSDWDLDAAFLRSQNACCLSGIEPFIQLRIDVKSINGHSNTEIQKNEVRDKVPLQRSSSSTEQPHSSDFKQLQIGFQGLIMNHMEKTLNLVSRALNFSEDPDLPRRPPLNQSEFLSFLSPVGHVVKGEKLREVIYNGGVEPSFRKVAWKHILNVYPEGMSGKERLDYMKKKSAEYIALRDVWKDCLQNGQVSSNLSYVTNMVRKDVLRTDRHHKFYSGSDDNQNITSLFNILTTYALNHPIVSYCQGMSDLASPLLVVMSDEAHAYICFCALMNRLYSNFLLDGEAMTLKFSHLSESLQIYDPVFFAYLQSQQADDLLFCYRWLLLELKREFAFEDALHMLEVLWSSLPSQAPLNELSLKEKEFTVDINSVSEKESPIDSLIKSRENAYTKFCAIRRQSSSYSLTSNMKGKFITKRMNLSLDENIGKKNCISSYQISKEYQSLDETFVNREVDSCNYLDTQKIDKSNEQTSVDNNHSGEDVSSIKLIKNLAEFRNFSINKKSSENLKMNKVSKGDPISSRAEECEQFNDNVDSHKILQNIEKHSLPSISSRNIDKNTDEVFVWENPLHNNSMDFKNIGIFNDIELLKKEKNNYGSHNGQSNQSAKKKLNELKPNNSKFFSNMSQELENARKNCEIILSQKRSTNLQTIASTISNFQKKYEMHSQPQGEFENSCEEVSEMNCTKSLSVLLPPNQVFGGGNPFLIFLCLTLLIQHRDYIMRNRMDYNELAMYFDKMVRKHNVLRVLNQARNMYESYVKEQENNSYR